MPRTARPWWRSQRNMWCVTVAGRRIQLGPHPEGAAQPKYNKRKDLWNVPDAIEDAWKAMQRGEEPVASPNSSWAILDAFLDWTEKNRSPGTYDWYVDHLQRFKDGVPNASVEKLKAHHIQRWLDRQKRWGVNYKRGMVTAIRRVFNWAIKQDLVSRNPAAGVERPAATHREQLITPKQFNELLRNVADENFRDLLRVVWWTGCRPQEIVAVEARHLGDGFWEFPRDESKGKQHERQVFLTDAAFKICKKWAKRHPEGPIFRNMRGRPWTAFAFNNRFSRLKEALGYKLCMYALRHSYAHHAITSGGLSLEETASLLGHTSTQMVYKVYGKLRKNKTFMRAAAQRAVKPR